MKAGHRSTTTTAAVACAIAAEIDRVVTAGGHIVIACSALKRAYRDRLLHGRRDNKNRPSSTAARR